MNEIQQSESVDFRQFQDKVLEYESCEHCSRSFFKGKLKYHQKFCTQASPMIKSPIKVQPNKRIPYIQDKASSMFSHQQKKCPTCHTKLPAFLYDSHTSKCENSSIHASELTFKQMPSKNFLEKRINTNRHFRSKQIQLPRIQNTAFGEKHPKKVFIEEHYKIKIREELSCFRKALEVQQVVCNSCGRKFSKEASLRHIPICNSLKMKEQKSIALKKKKGVSLSLMNRSFGKNEVETKPKSKSIFSNYSQSPTKPVQQEQSLILLSPSVPVQMPQSQQL